jgi:dCMP deaminase
MLLRMAEISSMRGTCNRKQVGAIIARDTRVISSGYVGSPPGTPHCLDAGCIIGPEGGCIRTQHAEANAIAFAAKKGIATEGSTLYVTLSPCIACAKLIIAAGIIQVVYITKYRDESGLNYLEAGGVRVYASH